MRLAMRLPPKDAAAKEFITVVKGADLSGCERPLRGIERNRDPSVTGLFHQRRLARAAVARLDVESGGEHRVRLKP